MHAHELAATLSPALLAVALPLLIPTPTAAQRSSQGGIGAQELPDLVRGEQEIDDLQGGFQGVLDDFDVFGASVAAIGDLDGDGLSELAVGAFDDDDGGQDRGAVWILFLDPTGRVRTEQKISETAGGFTASLPDKAWFGSSVEGLGDLDGDGVRDLAVGARNDQGGAVYVLFLNADGTVASQVHIGSGTGGFPGQLDPENAFGSAIAALGDLDGDGFAELAVGDYLDDDGGSDRGAVWTLELNPDGTVRSASKISSTSGGFTGVLGDDFWFGRALAVLGDLDGDGVPDLAVGQSRDQPDGTDTRVGSVWILFLNADETVSRQQKISRVDGGFGGTLVAGDEFGNAVRAVGDLDGDGVVDLAVGAWGDDDGGENRGATWLLHLRTDGTVASQAKISTTHGGFLGSVEDHDYFGTALAAPGDLDGDGVGDLVVSAFATDGGGVDRGAVWILFLTDQTLPITRGSGPRSRALERILAAYGGTPFEQPLRSLCRSWTGR